MNRINSYLKLSRRIEELSRRYPFYANMIGALKHTMNDYFRKCSEERWPEICKTLEAALTSRISLIEKDYEKHRGLCDKEVHVFSGTPEKVCQYCGMVQTDEDAQKEMEKKEVIERLHKFYNTFTTMFIGPPEWISLLEKEGSLDEVKGVEEELYKSVKRYFPDPTIALNPITVLNYRGRVHFGPRPCRPEIQITPEMLQRRMKEIEKIKGLEIFKGILG